MNKLQIFILMIATLSIDVSAQNVIIPFDSNWKYYDLGDKPDKIMGKDFIDIGYDDSLWLMGPAELGYGDGDEATLISDDALAAYFRHEFTMTNPNAHPEYEVNLIFDDGAVVYLNGSEIGRVNMADGIPDYLTYATAIVDNNAQTTFSIPASEFIDGANTFAVEVHQSNPGSSDISFNFQLAEEPTIIRGPYLQKLTTSGVTIKWRTSFETESIVSYGIDTNSMTNQVSDLTLKTEHEIEITGLTGSKFFYQIENNSGVLDGPDENMYFQLAPSIGSTGPLNAWILGDPGTGNQNARNVRDAYYAYRNNDHTDMILFLGDNAYNSGTDDEYQYAVFQNMYEDLMKKTVSWSCLGNHDGYTANSSTQSGPYYDIFTFPTDGESGGTASGTEAYYSFDYGNVHFMVLESYETDRDINSPMYNWALSDIQNTSQNWIVAFWHHPAYTKGSHDSDNVGDSAGSMQDMRENFLPMLEENGVDLVLSGHSHSYERSYFVNGHYGNSTTFDHNIHTIPINGNGDGKSSGTGEYEKDICVPGSVYITTGSAGKISGGLLNHPIMYYSVSKLGSVVLEVENDTMNVKFVRENQDIDDFFTIEKGAFLSPCDDGDPCTYNDAYDVNCNCAGVIQPLDSDMDGTDDCIDECPFDPAKIVLGICGCGVSDTADMDSDGTIDCLDACPNDPTKILVGFCGCGIAETDTDNDATPDCIDGCPMDFNKTSPGVCGCGVSDNIIDTSCNDNDPCTINDIYKSNCQCIGTFQDTDGDGVCDNDDICAGGDDSIDSDSDGLPDFCDPCNSNLFNTPCDDGLFCTTNDLYDQACNCVGTFSDSNGDGICDFDQIGCGTFMSDDFELNNTNWTLGGNDTDWAMSPYSPNGDYSLLIRDNSGPASTVTSSSIDLTNIDSIVINFDYMAVNMDGTKDFFLDITTDGGATYTVIKQWIHGTDFSNNIVYSENIGMTNSFGSSLVNFRFTCRGTINDDQVYLDDIEIQLCEIGCIDYMIQNTNPIVQQSEYLEKAIESNGVIPAGSTIEFVAGNYVELSKGFEVELSSVFHAFIEYCQ